jgi:hypothetical protein
MIEKPTRLYATWKMTHLFFNGLELVLLLL